MKLITKRLTVMTLNPEQMIMYMRNVHDLEKELTLTYHSEPIEGEFRDIVRRQARLCEDNEDDFLWHTFWMLNLNRELIGGAYFKGLPDNEGMVEITCGVNNDFMNQGYATEAVNKLVEWALRQEGVKFVTAETERNDFVAHRVLEKCGFEKYKATERFYRWMIDSAILAKRLEATRKQLGTAHGMKMLESANNMRQLESANNTRPWLVNGK